jgi:tetratricopeptide (TPR) repeat protein
MPLDSLGTEGRAARPASPLLVKVSVLVAFLFTAIHALWGRGSVLLYGDEVHTIARLHLSYGELFRTFDAKGSGIALPLLQKLACDLVGESLWSYRLPAILGALGSVPALYFLATRWVGRETAALGTLALATNPVFLYYAGFGRIYALLVLGALLATLALARALEPVPRLGPRLGRLALLAVAVGLLPFLHLTALGFVAGLGLAGALVLAGRRAPLRTWLALLASFAAGGALAVALHLPAWSSLRAFVEDKAGGGADAEFGGQEVAWILAGGQLAAWIWLGATLAGAALLVLRTRGRAWLPVLCALAPILALAAARPSGMPYAYARYLVTALPFLALLGCFALHSTLARLGRSATATLALALLPLAVGVSAGPLGVRHRRDGIFAGCETSLLPLPAFDVAWEETPPFYRELGAAGPVTILEVPELPNRANYLYRNYALQHGQEVRIGTLFERQVGAPYLHVPGTAPEDLEADVLVLHIDLDQELTRYWSAVFTTFETGDAALAPLMDAQGRPGRVRGRALALLAAARALEEQLGPPVHRNRYALAWDLRRVPGPDRPLRLEELTPVDLSPETLDRIERLNDEGIALAGSGRMDRALARFERALTLAPDHPTSLVNRAAALAALGRQREAAGAFERALQQNPYSADAHHNYGLLLERIGRSSEAAEHLRVAAELDPRMQERGR